VFILASKTGLFVADACDWSRVIFDVAGKTLVVTLASSVNTIGAGPGRKLQFSDRQLQICNGRDMGAQNFNFDPGFPQNGGFSAPNFVFGRHFIHKKQVFLEMYCWGNVHDTAETRSAFNCNY